jgi:hypothetical protein
MKSMTISLLRNLTGSAPPSMKDHCSCRNTITYTQCNNKNNSLSDIIYSHFCSRAVQFSGLSLLPLLGLLVIVSLPVYAQDSPGRENEEKQLEPPGNISASYNQKETVLNTTSTDIPVLEKLSDKGSYKVQLRWGQPPSLLPVDGFDMEIVFLNASAPPASPQTFPTTETNETGGATTMGSTGYTAPSLVERMVPIQSYDIAVYSDDGRELWKKENQAVQGGRAYERVTLEKPYTGNITISIHNIKGTGGLSGTIAGPLSEESNNLTSSIVGSDSGKDNTQSSDSVKFSARVMGANP